MIDVGALLEKVEAAAPIDAVEAVAAALGRDGRRPGGDAADRRLQRPGRRPADLGRRGSRAPAATGVGAGGDAAARGHASTSACCARSSADVEASTTAPG